MQVQYTLPQSTVGTLLKTLKTPDILERMARPKDLELSLPFRHQSPTRAISHPADPAIEPSL